MQRWEYLTIRIRYRTWTDDFGRTGTIDDQMQDGSGGLTGLLNELGEQGWELAGVGDRDVYDTGRLFLKRPRS
jgi:hypothetical protein